MLIRKYVIPLLAIAGAAVAAYTVVSENRPQKAAPPVADPARSPYEQPVAASGIIEASTQNIAIGTPLAGVVTRVTVKVGDEVKAGGPLFTIDDRAALAELEVRRAALVVAEQNLVRLKDAPRPEDVPPAQAR